VKNCTDALGISLCAVCRQPGHCCTNIKVNATWWDDEPLADQTLRVLGVVMTGRPTGERFVDHKTERTYGDYALDCTQLQVDGRCGIYDDRPYMCKHYPPGHDPLCVMHIRPPKLIASDAEVVCDSENIFDKT